MDKKIIHTTIDGVVVEPEVALEHAGVMIDVPVDGKKDSITLSSGEAKELMAYFGIKIPHKLNEQKITVEYQGDQTKVYGRK